MVAPGKGGARIVALNRAAQDAGLLAGDLLSNARSKVLKLQSCEADPTADAAALRKLALWALRYTPIAAPWDEASGGDGLFSVPSAICPWLHSASLIKRDLLCAVWDSAALAT